MIEVRDLTIGYGERIVMENLNFTISSGEIVCIMGGSGCGKSTLLKHLIGLYEPMKGDILIRNKSIVTADEKEKKAIMRSFGVTYQGGALFGSMTVAENVELPLREYTDLPLVERMEIARKKLELVGLAGFGDYMPSELSEHKCTYLLWPERPDNWRGGAKPAQKAFTRSAGQTWIFPKGR